MSRVIIIPAEEGDVLAHADGMVKFIDEHTMFISDFLGIMNLDIVFKRLFKNKCQKLNL